MRTFFIRIFCVFACAAVFACGDAQRDNPDDPGASNYTHTSAQISPTPGSDILGRDSIVFIFNDPVDIDSLLIEGDMADCYQAWSATAFENDTLTLTPGSAGDSIWPTGDDQSLLISGSSMLGLPITDIDIAYNISYSVTATHALAEGSTITGHETVSFTFGDDMDHATLALSGSLDSDWALVIASKASWNANTLTINSSALWAAGNGNITIACETADGVAGKKPSASLTVNYSVFHGVCVSATSGDDLNDGSVQHPIKTIPAGIAQADALYIAASEVRIAEGTYTVNYSGDAATRIIMVEGISLYGGYADDNWGIRDTVNNETVFEDISNIGGTAETDPVRTIECGSGITNSTLIDSLTIRGSITAGASAGQVSTAIFCNNGADPTISNNKIYGGGDKSGSVHCAIINYSSAPATNLTQPKILNNIIDGNGGINVAQTMGINNYDATPIIKNNTISGGYSIDSMGIYNYNSYSNPVISNNIIDGGNGTTSYGIYNLSTGTGIIRNNVIDGGKGIISINAIYNIDASPDIQNNTIVCGYSPLPGTAGLKNGIPSYCIYLLNNSDPIIENNIIAMLDTDADNPDTYTAYAIYEAGANADPASIKNNDFYNFDAANIVYGIYYNEGTTAITDIAGLHGLDAVNYSGNIIADPLFVNISQENYHLISGSSPAAGGGLDLSGFFTDDLDGGAARTVPWSIGAYEY